MPLKNHTGFSNKMNDNPENKVEQLVAANAELEGKAAADAVELEALKIKESRLKAKLVRPSSI